MAAYSPLHSIFTLAPSLRGASQKALSMYIPARLEGFDARHYDIVFGDLLHRYRERLGDDEVLVLEEELPRLRAALATARPAGCAALAGFADSKAGVLELIKLPGSTPERIEVGELLLAPMLRQLEQFPPALIVVVDKERAVTFRSILDEVEPMRVLEGVEVRHSRAGGWSALNAQHRGDNRARANLATVVRAVKREMATGAFAELYVAGPDEARAQFERLLPPSQRALVAGHLGVSLDSAELTHDLLSAVRSNRATNRESRLKAVSR